MSGICLGLLEAACSDTPPKRTLPSAKIVAKHRIVIGLGELMGRNWRLAYWIVMVLSGLWLALSSVASAGLLFRIMRGYERIEEYPITDFVIGSIIILQPLLIAWLIKRAHRMRMTGSTPSIIARAALPISTIALLFAAVAATNYYQILILNKRAMEEAWYARNSTITFDCSRESKSVDFDPKQIGAIGLRLTSIRRDQQPDEWLVTWPDQTPISATSFDFDTGSFGGSQGISWQSANGTNMVAILSFSDIVLGRYGSQTIWVRIEEGNAIGTREFLDSIHRKDFTCGPNLETYEPAS
jgi:hypothetical protein